MRRRNFERPWPEQNVTYERKSATSELWIPLASCLLTGSGVGVFLFTLAWGIVGLDFKSAAVLALGTDALISSAAITWRFGKGLKNEIERATGLDINRDGWIGEPEPELVVLKGPGETVSKREAFLGELKTFIRGCAIDTSARRWEPSLGRTRYQGYRDALIEAGHARWTNSDKRQGWELVTPPENIIGLLEE